ncbi:MAG: DUF3299 domain-containing protein [Rubrivivax sp.]
MRSLDTPDGWRRRVLGGSSTVAAALCLPLWWSVTAAHAQPPGTGLPPGIGQGPGFHDPRSAFQPLQEREGVVSWKLLSSVQLKPERARVVPVFPPAIQALNDKTVRVQGFMMPLEPGERQRHFLLSSVPTTCSFCVLAGPEGLVEVRTRTPVKYTVDAITVEGRMAVLSDDKFGLLYRVTRAEPVP